MSALKRSWRLSELLPELRLKGEDVSVTGLSQDSRTVKPGDLFIARKGLSTDGRAYIYDAILKGSAALLVEGSAAEVEVLQSRYPQVPMLAWDPALLSLGHLADRFYNSPSKRLRIIGITGTNGKTSSAHFLAQALNALGQKAALLGTLGNGFLDHLDPSAHTTPDPLSLHRWLAEYSEQGAQAVVMEVSSHAIDQGRIEAVDFDLVAYTNLSRDHLDYHETMENYAAAKARLFERYGVPLQLLNLDDQYAGALAQKPAGTVTRVGFSTKRTAFVQLLHLKQYPAGMELSVELAGQRLAFKLPLLGRFNTENILLVIGALSLLGFSDSELQSAVNQVLPVTGRMQLLTAAQAPTVIVDYAHTPDALEKALKACREHLLEGHLQLIFGCGGDRDKGKRPLMAKVAESYADQIWLTSDNPRSEDPEAIIQQVLAGFESSGKVHVEVDRSEAIKQAVAAADATDLILLAGKGHESYQEISGVRLLFSDIDQAADALAQRSAI